MFEHIDAVCDSNRDRAARTAFTDDDRDDRHAQLEAFSGGARNGFRLTAFFSAHAWIGTGSVNEGDQRQLETVSHFHDAHSLAVAFRTGRAEIVLEARLGIRAFFLAQNGQRPDH